MQYKLNIIMEQHNHMLRVGICLESTTVRLTIHPSPSGPRLPQEGLARRLSAVG